MRKVKKKFIKFNDIYLEITRLILATIVFVSSILLSKNIINPKKEYTLVLNGEKTINVSLKGEYKDPGFELFENDKKIDLDKIKVTVKNDIDTSNLGQYTYSYEISYGNQIFKEERIVNVVDDIPPVIKTDIETVEMYSCQSEGKLNLNFTAEDNYDGVITSKVNEKIEDDKVILSVVDSSGNETRKEIPIVKPEEPSPKIVLNGRNIIYVKKGEEYIEEGASAFDGCDNKIDEEIVKTGEVDTNTPGTYEMKYTVTRNEKTSTITRNVIVYDGVINNPIEANRDKVVYLTFDDGPGRYTEELLDILKKYNVKATFFVTNQFKSYVPLIKREYEEGHTIAVHTLTHKWSVYDSVETYIKDFNDMNNIIEEYTGSKTNLFRFPGGSSNTISKGHSKGVVSAIANEMTKRGYVYFDWNVDSCDAAGAKSNQIYKNVTTGIEKKKESVVLMHDIKRNTIDVIEDIIVYGLNNGFTFDTLNVSSPTVHHHINN